MTPISLIFFSIRAIGEISGLSFYRVELNRDDINQRLRSGVHLMTKPLLHKELSFRIVGAAMEVHRVLGPGFLESVYEQALAHEFELKGIPFQRQALLAVRYKAIIAGEFRADFLVDGNVVVELKATKGLTEINEAQLLNYLKGTGYRVGLLLNFGTPSLEHKRRVN